MSYEDGWKALNLDFPETVPRTEYSAHCLHWPLVRAVTGIDTDRKENRDRAATEFCRKWDYSFRWQANVSTQYLMQKGGRISDMGHAVYAGDGSDYSDKVNAAFTDVEDALQLDPCNEYGEFDRKKLVESFNMRYKDSCERFPFAVNMGGVYITLISGLISIYGWDMMLYAMGYDIGRFNKVLDGYCNWVKQFYQAYAESDVPVFMCHDDIVWTSGPFADPEWYRKQLFPKLKKLLIPLREAGKKICFTSDGAYTMFFDDIVDCGPECFCMEPCVDMELFARKYGKTHAFIGNADTRILQFGTRDDIRREVKRCMDIGKKYPGFFMNVGNHIPPSVPVDNALYYNEAYEELRQR